MIHADLQKEENGQDLETGLIALIKGTARFFTVCVVDSGYDYVPHNVNLKNISMSNPID